MYLTTDECLDAIQRHTRGLAGAAENNLARRVEHCPAWSVGDLVWHLTGVHRFWEHVVRERPATQPSLPEASRPADGDLVPALLAGLDALVDTLRSADQDASCWTWGLVENVGFVTRHQVQEAAVHHWDVVNAVGPSAAWSMDPLEAIDAVDEFLTHSVGNSRWVVEGAERLGGYLWFCPCYADTAACPSWYVADGDLAGTVAVMSEPPASDLPAVGSHGDPATLLLWLYGRVPDRVALPDSDLRPEDTALIDRFRKLTFTD